MEAFEAPLLTGWQRLRMFRNCVGPPHPLIIFRAEGTTVRSPEGLIHLAIGSIDKALALCNSTIPLQEVTVLWQYIWWTGIFQSVKLQKPDQVTV